MKHIIISILVILLVALFGCAKQAPVQPQVQPSAPQAPVVVTPAVPVAPEPVQPAPTPSQPPELQEQEKQLTITGTDITTAHKTDILSDINCTVKDKIPQSFTMTITNIENKTWRFEGTNTHDRNTIDYPIMIINALQVTYDTIATACGKIVLNSGESVSCRFDYAPASNMRGKINLRSGLDPSGVQKKNTVVLKTVDHAVEQWFYCQ